MIELAVPVERAVLVAAPHSDEPQRIVDEHLQELAHLADTAGAEVVATMVQRLDAPNPKLYIGSGKADQLRELAGGEDATIVVFDEDLSPAQGSALEKRLGIRVMDRTELILDIFALRARTAEARLQVELAQLEYMRPRLKRMWTHLSRTQGGIGTRGPGETQLETDRRIIDRRITRLRRELRDIAKSRDVRRKGRATEFRVALVGYTNAGKSSILRGLSGSDVFVENRLFATLDSATRAVELDGGYRALVTDTVGFIRKLPHDLVASFRATLEEIGDADLLVHVIDAASPSWEHQVEAVEVALHEIGASERPTLLAFNKIDRLTHGEEEALRRRSNELLGPHVFTTVFEDHGLAELRDELRRRAAEGRPTVRVSVPVTDGRTLAEAYREAEVLGREETDSVVVLTARVPADVLGRWRQTAGVRVAEGTG
ncbi:MAG TPA: GTPase HflX [Gemmatimonadota bacterium]|nr:GTPase HflX [Gemmatimonadota bacterium]